MRTDNPNVRPWAAGMSFLFGVFIASIIYLPAALLSPILASSTGGFASLHDVQGSVWKGSATLRIKGDGAMDEPDDGELVTWQIRPQWTGFTGALMSACCLRNSLSWDLKFSLTGADFVIKDIEYQMTAKSLAKLGTPFNTLDLDGDLRLSSTEMQLKWVDGQVRVLGNAQVDALKMSTRLAQLKPVGSYRLTYSGGNSNLSLHTVDGPLHLSGTGKWAGQSMGFQGEARAEEGAEKALANLLSIIGQPSGNKTLIRIGKQ